MNEQDAVITKKTRKRSPSYPAIDLESGIQRARTLKEKGGTGDYYLPFHSALSFWGYAPKSSNGWLILAALKKYGLLDDRGTGKDREVKLSKLAQVILFYENHPLSKEYIEAVREAALTPPIHSELWNEYSDAPNEVLKPYLVLKRKNGKFTEKAADDCIQQYQNTISFAKLIKGCYIPGHDKDKIPIQTEEKIDTMPKDQSTSVPAMQASGALQQTFNFPVKISDKMEANLTIQYPMEEKDLRDFLAALEALKPGILQSVLNKQNEKEN